ncbi:MAG: hypothetical protein ACTSX4_12620, partial [Candidatus Helarchaeota archaeon]
PHARVTHQGSFNYIHRNVTFMIFLNIERSKQDIGVCNTCILSINWYKKSRKSLENEFICKNNN